jgi:hypothetical protein
LFCANFKAKLDRFFDVIQRFFSRRTLADTPPRTWGRQPGMDGHSAEGLLGNPDTIFVAVEAYDQFHFKLRVTFN